MEFSGENVRVMHLELKSEHIQGKVPTTQRQLAGKLKV